MRCNLKRLHKRVEADFESQKPGFCILFLVCYVVEMDDSAGNIVNFD